MDHPVALQASGFVRETERLGKSVLYYVIAVEKKRAIFVYLKFVSKP